MSKLQWSEIPLREFEQGFVIIEPASDRARIQLQFPSQLQSPGLKLFNLSPEEAYTIGSSLVEHATECGYDFYTGETRDVS